MSTIASRMFVVLGLLVSATSAWANEAKYYPAWSCVGGSLPYSTAGLSFGSAGGTFYCPAVTPVSDVQSVSSVDV